MGFDVVHDDGDYTSGYRMACYKGGWREEGNDDEDVEQPSINLFLTPYVTGLFSHFPH